MPLSISCYRSRKTEIRNSPVEGKGVFATEKIMRNEIVAIKAGHIVTAEQLSTTNPPPGDYALQIHDDFYITPVSADEVDAMTVFINHSCDPNIGFVGQIVYVAIRDIEPDEELCHDYAMERSDNYSLVCNCQSPHCRHVISGDDWKDPGLQKRYGNYFSSYILEKIKAHL